MAYASPLSHPLCFLTAYKSCDILLVLAGPSDPKNPDPYYLTTLAGFTELADSAEAR